MTEHWMDKRLREGKPINLSSNLIRISAKDLLILHEEKNRLLGIRKSLKDASDEGEGDRKEYLY